MCEVLLNHLILNWWSLLATMRLYGSVTLTKHCLDLTPSDKAAETTKSCKTCSKSETILRRAGNSDVILSRFTMGSFPYCMRHSKSPCCNKCAAAVSCIVDCRYGSIVGISRSSHVCYVHFSVKFEATLCPSKHPVMTRALRTVLPGLVNHGAWNSQFLIF